jgi:DUF4097 and DUF4098 domain-containing protein YvlB
MSAERMTILKMLEEGKITAAEAERLLNALGEQQKSDEEEKDIFDALGEGLDRAFKAVQNMDLGKIVDSTVASVGEKVEAVQRSDVGDMVSEFIDEVTESIGDITGESKRELSQESEWALEVEEVIGLKANTSNGEVEVVGVDEEEMSVKALIKVKAPDDAAARAFFEQVAVSVERQGDEIVIKKEHPKPPKKVRVQVNYYIRCPRRLEVEVHTLNGGVRVHGMAAAIQAATANGDVEIRGGRGRLHARTKNGKVLAEVDVLEERGEFSSANGKVEVKISAGQAPVEAQTLNGSVAVSLPADFAGQLEAQTSNGRVHCDFPVIQAGPGRKNRLAGPLGKGGETLVKLKTLNGNIDLHKLADSADA